MDEAGRENVVYPVRLDGCDFKITVTRESTVPPPPGFKVGDANAYVGYYRCGDKIGTFSGSDGPVVRKTCPQHKGEPLLAVADKRNGGRCPRHGVVPVGFRVENDQISREPECPDCIASGLTPQQTGWVGPSEDETVVQAPKPQPATEAVQPPPAAPSEPEKPAITCPLGKDPCALRKPDCNISPGLFRVQFAGREVDMCGDCVEQCGADVLATAKSIDRLSVNVRKGDG